MNPILILIISLVPGLLWVSYFYLRDKYEREPSGLVLRAFVFGAAAVVPAGVFEYPFRGILQQPTDLFTLLLFSIFVIGLVEEYVKYLAIKISVFGNDEFDEVMDGIVYGVAAGLGFAAAENYMYTVRFGIEVGVVRAIFTSLAHASFSGIVGYYMGRAKFAKGAKTPVILSGLTISVLLHGLYDFLVLSRILPSALALLLILFFFRYLNKKIQGALEDSPFK